MEPARAGTDVRDSRFDGLHAEATAAVGYSANTVRSVRERYREASSEVDEASPSLGERETELAKLDVAERTLERTWLFLERGDATLLTDVGGPATAGDLRMRIVEAQEAERARLAQEIHDGPAQALSNTIFKVEFIERVIDTDAPLARTELRLLGQLLRGELDDMRAFISQLRPPLLDELGLDGAIGDTVEHLRAMTGLAITTELSAPAGGLSDGQRTVVLRVAQEALQNVRKHASARTVTVATRLDEDGWVLEVRDDGRGFDVGALAARGRRNFGLQFMRERAELVGARFDVRSRMDGGTVVRLAIPTGPATGGEESS